MFPEDGRLNPKRVQRTFEYIHLYLKNIMIAVRKYEKINTITK